MVFDSIPRVAKRRVFYSFHYDLDCWRVSQVRNIGVVEGSKLASDNDWETVKRGGDEAIQRWIDDQLVGTSCTVVLIGAETASRRWVRYEIEKSWNEGKGLLGVHVHKLNDRHGRQASQGQNPFETFTLNGTGRALSSVVKAYNPSGITGSEAYTVIANNLAKWIDEAIQIRKNQG